MLSCEEQHLLSILNINLVGFRLQSYGGRFKTALLDFFTISTTNVLNFCYSYIFKRRNEKTTCHTNTK